MHDGGVEQQGLHSRKQGPGELKPGAVHDEERARTLMRDHRPKHDESADGADEDDLADGKRNDQPFAHGIVKREHEVASQHDQDAGEDQVLWRAKLHVAVHPCRRLAGQWACSRQPAG
jgi:hypothetical protein